MRRRSSSRPKAARGALSPRAPSSETSATPRLPSADLQSASTQARAAASDAVWAITNAAIHPIAGPDIPRGTIVVRGNRIEAIGADVQVPAGAKTIDGAAGGRLSRIHQRAYADGAQRAWSSRLRGRQRDARLQPPASHSRGVSRRERDDSDHARERRDDRRGRAVRRDLRWRGRGDEPGRLDVGGRHAPRERRHRIQLSRHWRDRRAWRWWWRRGSRRCVHRIRRSIS